MMRPDPEDAAILGATSEDALEPCVLGRPPIGPKVSTRITVEQLAQIERLAADAAWTRAEALRYVIGWGLAVILRTPPDRELWHARDSGGNTATTFDDLVKGPTRPPPERKADDEFDLRSEIDAQAAARGMTPAELLGSAWAGVAKRGGQ